MKSTFTLSSKWDHRYLELARAVGTWSKDPSTRIGAVAVGIKGQVLAQGYNGLPRGVSDSDERYQDRETKYKYIVHAEQNLIYNATWNGVSLDQSTLYVTGLPVCSECAKGVIQVGIKRVVMPASEDIKGWGDKARWNDSWELSASMFKEANVLYEFI